MGNIRKLEFGEMVPESKHKMTKSAAEKRRKRFFKNMKDPSFVIKDMHYYYNKKTKGSDESDNPLPRY